MNSIKKSNSLREEMKKQRQMNSSNGKENLKPNIVTNSSEMKSFTNSEANLSTSSFRFSINHHVNSVPHEIRLLKKKTNKLIETKKIESVIQ